MDACGRGIGGFSSKGLESLKETAASAASRITCWAPGKRVEPIRKGRASKVFCVLSDQREVDSHSWRMPITAPIICVAAI